jgi:MOSC domain-containing protein YiiM
MVTLTTSDVSHNRKGLAGYGTGFRQHRVSSRRDVARAKRNHGDLQATRKRPRHLAQGDRQANLSVHGGENKAVYCYPIAHYDYWKRELPGRDVPMAIFGENFTTDGLLEDSVHVGDQFSVGSAEVVVTQPRLPRYKLGVRFESDDMMRRFLDSGRTGFYLAVTREGEVGADDEFEVIARDPNAVPISEITRLYITKRYGEDDVTSVRQALRIVAMPDRWKEYFQERLRKMKV